MSNGITAFVSSADRALRRQVAMLSSDRDFELGDRPDTLAEMIAEIEHLLADVQFQVGPTYRLERQDMTAFNRYYLVVKELKDLIGFLKDLQRANRGSRNKTQEAIRRLDQCINAVKSLAPDETTSLSYREMGLLRLEQRIERLTSDDPARNRFYLLRSNLEKATQSGADSAIVEPLWLELDNLSLNLSDGEADSDKRVYEFSNDRESDKGSWLDPSNDESPIDPGVPTIGIITALQEEYAAVRAMIDNGHDHYTRSEKAGEQCYLGQIPAAKGAMHTVVLSFAVSMGNNIAATLATDLLNSFPSIETIIIVGIAGGTPNHKKPDQHVRLGDVVVCNEQGVIQYDFVKEEMGGVEPRHPPRQPSARLLHAAKQIEVDELSGTRDWVNLITRGQALSQAQRPSPQSDILLLYTTGKNGPMSPQRVPHPRDKKRIAREPRVFIGPMASSNTLQKNPFKRDYLRDKYGVKAIEMENSGIADAAWVSRVDYFAVRGICDYCDQTKNDKWHGYAALAAAAYTRALLAKIPARSPC